MPRIRVILTAIAVLSCLPAGSVQCQSPETGSCPLEQSWRWVRFGPGTGLPSSKVMEIMDAPDGTPWAVTEAGVAWYDGFSWNVVPADLPLATEEVCRPHGFFRGKLVLSSGGRVSLVEKTGAEILPPRDIDYARILDEDSMLLFAGNRVLRVSANGIDTVETPEWYEIELRGTPKTDGIGRFYYCSSNRLSRVSGESLAVILDAGNHRLVAENLAVNARGNGCLAVSFPRQMRGIWEWDSGGKVSKTTLQSALSPRLLDVGQNGNAIVIYEEGRYAARFGGRWTSVRRLPLDFRGINRLRFRTNGDVWLATNNGLYLCRLSDTPAQHFSWPETDERNRINDILCDRAGTVWCATSNGIVRISPDGDERSWTSILGTSFRIVTGVVEDADGYVWICSGADFTGVFRWDGHTWSHHTAMHQGRDVRIHRFCKGRGNRIWLAGHSPDARMQNEDNPGAFILESGRIRSWDRNDGLSHRRIYSICESRDGAIWFGTYSGLSRWKNDTWTYFINSRPGKHYVTTIAEHVDGRVYFGMERSSARGLGFVDHDDSIHYITNVPQLVGVIVEEVKADGRGCLWVTTDNGLNCLENGTWTHYGKEIGLQSPRLWPVYPFGDSLYIGTAAMGWSVIDTRRLDSPPLRIEAAPPVIEGNDVSVSWTPLVHWGAVPPERVFCRYRLDSGAWSRWSRSSAVQFPDISFGDHSLQLQAMGPHGRYDEAGLTLQFSVPLPPILRWYILGPLILLSIALLGLWIVHVHRRREAVRDLKEGRDRLKSLAEELVNTEESERRRLAQFLHDGVGQTLSLTYLQLHRWQNRERPEDSTLSEIRGLLDKAIRDTHAVTFDLCPPFLYDLSLNDALIWTAEQVEKQHDHEIEKDIPRAPVRVQRELHVLLFLGARELLVNSIKHARAKRLRLTLELRKDRLRIHVTDDGIGFPASIIGDTDRRDGGLGLYNMRRRFADFGVELRIHTTEGRGSRVSLLIPGEAIERETLPADRDKLIRDIENIISRDEG